MATCRTRHPRALAAADRRGADFASRCPGKCIVIMAINASSRRAFPLFNAGWPSLKPNPSKTCLCVMVATGDFLPTGNGQILEDRRAVEKEKKFLGDTRESLFFNNCYWIYNLETAAKIAEVIGENDSAAVFRKRADVVRAAVHKTFFHTGRQQLRQWFSGLSRHALLADVPPPT